MTSESNLPLYAQLRDELRARILDGHLAPDERLPSESELTGAHGVSRITVRQALGDLEAEGLIVRRQGKGAFVAPPRTRQSLNRLEGMAEALAGHGEVHSKRLSTQRLPAPAEVAQLLEIAPGEEAVRLVGLRYLERQPLSVNVSWFRPALGDRIARMDLSGRDILQVLESDLGCTVQQADLEISAAPMPAAEARLLGVRPGVPSLRVHRVVRGAQAEPLHVETIVFRSDSFSYKLSLTR